MVVDVVVEVDVVDVLVVVVEVVELVLEVPMNYLRKNLKLIFIL